MDDEVDLYVKRQNAMGRKGIPNKFRSANFCSSHGNDSFRLNGVEGKITEGCESEGKVVDA